jgi:hypothetical protein
MTDYYSSLTYLGNNGQRVKLRFEGLDNRRLDWFYRFGEKIEFGPFKSKFDALLDASHKCGKSGEAMNFNPIHECVE